MKFSTPEMASGKLRLIQELLKAGYEIREDSPIIFIARKTYQSICGEKEASLCIFSGRPDWVSPSYHSEGRNILSTLDFPLTADPKPILEKCERYISQSYAVRLLRLFSSPSTQETVPCIHSPQSIG